MQCIGVEILFKHYWFNIGIGAFQKNALIKCNQDRINGEKSENYSLLAEPFLLLEYQMVVGGGQI